MWPAVGMESYIAQISATMGKEEKQEGKEKAGAPVVDLASSMYFTKHPKAIANPQTRSVSLLPYNTMERKPKQIILLKYK